MIVSLKFNNFKSYKNTAEFSFEALEDDFNVGSVTSVELKDGSTLRLLNAAVIFGANASGKSNVIYALASLADTVGASLTYKVNSQPFFIIPYAFDRDCVNKSTSIELDFIFEGKRYVYYVAGKKGFIQKEWLKEIYKGKKLIVFDRKSDLSIKTGSGWNADKGMVTDSNLLPNQLFLSWLATKESAGLQNVANYIADLSIYWGSSHSGSKYDRQIVMDTIIKDPNSKLFNQLNTLMKIADLGVARIEVKRNNDKDFKLPDSVDPAVKHAFIQQNRWDISLSHITSNPNEICVLNFAAESDGTQALFGVGARLLAALEKGAFVAYDEINDAIHPALLRFLVKLFQSPISNPKGAQLLFSTHDASVADHNTLRADQVWFVEKKNSVSDLYSAQDFDDVDIKVPFETWYRSGRFGARPLIGDLEEVFKN